MRYKGHVSKTISASESGSETIPATARDTRDHLILWAGRPFAPIPSVFIQTPTSSGSKPGPLAEFVRNGDKRGLLAFLFLHTIISSGDHGDGWSSTLDLRLWARALGTVETAEASAASSAATKILGRLVDRKLVMRRRSGRQRAVTITLLKGDGTNTPYTRPQGKSVEDRFLRLTTEFWTGDWDQTLSLPAIAMLLVALKEKPEFTLPTEHMPAWYGWSADTAERGFNELRETGLLHVVHERFPNPLSPTGLSTRNIYKLQHPFDRDSITDAKAAHALTRRQVASTGAPSHDEDVTHVSI